MFRKFVKSGWHSKIGLIAIALVLAVVIGGTAYASIVKVSNQVSINTWTLYLTSKDSSTWLTTATAKATITVRNTVTTAIALDAQDNADVTTTQYRIDMVANGLQKNTQYSIIYYADPWAGNGGHEIYTFKTSRTSTSRVIRVSIDAEDWQPIPCTTDANYPVGGKIWIVPSSDYSGGQMIAWNPDTYLFDTGLVNIP
jgi:hypothetical protein